MDYLPVGCYGKVPSWREYIEHEIRFPVSLVLPAVALVASLPWVDDPPPWPPEDWTEPGRASPARGDEPHRPP